MKKRILVFLLAVVSCFLLTFGLAACGQDEGDSGDTTQTPSGGTHTHSMTHHAKVEATCTSAGNVEYWSCSGCGKNFSDKNGKTELFSVTVKAKGHTYATSWTSDSTNHWHASTCGHRDEINCNEEHKFIGNNCTICDYTRQIRFTGIELGTDSLIINIGESYVFGYYGTPYNANEKVYLKTDAPEIIAIGKNGQITVEQVGVANVYVETESGLKSSMCAVKCVEIVAPQTPYVIDNWSNPAYFKTQTATISQMEFKFSTQASQYNSIKVLCYLTLKKDWCDFTRSCAVKINYKVKNPDGVVVKSGTFTTSAFSVGETVMFNDSFYLNISSGVQAGSYTIELSDVAW